MFLKNMNYAKLSMPGGDDIDIDNGDDVGSDKSGYWDCKIMSRFKRQPSVKATPGVCVSSHMTAGFRLGRKFIPSGAWSCSQYSIKKQTTNQIILAGRLLFFLPRTGYPLGSVNVPMGDNT